jgi:hypothetical protein
MDTLRGVTIGVTAFLVTAIVVTKVAFAAIETSVFVGIPAGRGGRDDRRHAGTRAIAVTVGGCHCGRYRR